MLELHGFVAESQAWPSAGGIVQVPPSALPLGRQTAWFRHPLAASPAGWQSCPKDGPAVQIDAVLEWLQALPSAQIAAAAEQSPPTGTGFATVCGAVQVPVQQPLPEHDIWSQLADTHSSSAKHVAPP